MLLIRQIIYQHTAHSVNVFVFQTIDFCSLLYSTVVSCCIHITQACKANIPPWESLEYPDFFVEVCNHFASAPSMIWIAVYKVNPKLWINMINTFQYTVLKMSDNKMPESLYEMKWPFRWWFDISHIYSIFVLLFKLWIKVVDHNGL